MLRSGEEDAALPAVSMRRSGCALGAAVRMAAQLQRSASLARQASTATKRRNAGTAGLLPSVLQDASLSLREKRLRGCCVSSDGRSGSIRHVTEGSCEELRTRA